ncbi:MAG: type II toxin-antitoxin system YafQ family toxin [Lachnospiraceae bacterium]|nr:type II toxin-antitoxin system YafQ family toxin [Lachnospiraceae bacterium]
MNYSRNLIRNEGFNECHIQSDWLLIYTKNEDEIILVASRTGTHSDLFDE